MSFIATADNDDGVNTDLVIFVEFVNTSGDWYACSQVGDVPPTHDISCNTKPANTNTNDQLTAVTADNFTAVIAEQ